MILLYSRDADLFVNDVIDYLETDFVRIGDRDSIKIKNINLKESKFIIDNKYDKDFNLFDVDKVWFNGGSPQNKASRYEKAQYRTLIDSILDKSNCFKIGKNYSKIEFNKIDASRVAFERGFNIPETILTNKKTDLEEFINQNNGRVICKRIGDEMFYEGDDFICNVGKTFEIDEIIFNKIPNEFAISLFQEKIIPEFEIRVFYFFEEHYSMAIFSFEKEVDIRESFLSESTRMVPFKLPKEISTKLKLIINDFGVNYCSVDLMYANMTYYFLEINPIGQVQFLNYRCNYYLEKEIAKKLNNEEKLSSC